MPNVTRVTKVACESCVDSILEESFGNLSRLEAASIAITDGYILPDHLCDRIETDGEIPCNCSAHNA